MGSYQQVDPQHLDRSDHLKKEGDLLGDNTMQQVDSQHLDLSDHLKRKVLSWKIMP
jgi:hypothetical protein